MKPLSNSFSLLIVEDDHVVRNMVAKVVARRFPDLTIQSAENGAAGLALFREQRHDIVLTDISMPVMDGIEMAAKMRAVEPGVKIIAVTAVADRHYLMDAIRIGITRYALKPYDFPLIFETLEDCLARVTLERRVQAQNAHIRTLSRAVEQGPGAVVIANAAGIVEYVNPSFSAITGYAPDDVIGQNLRTLVSPATANDSYEMIRSTITRGSEWRGEILNRKKDGKLYYQEVSISPLAGEDGAITNFVAVMEDVSERKRVEEGIRSLNSELEQRVRERTTELEAANQELTAFCYSVAHDLRAPLRCMSSFSSILLEEHAGSLEEDGREHLERIGAAASRMGRLIDDLLHLSRVTRRQLCRKRVDLSTLVHEAVATLKAQEPERLVEVAIAPGVEAELDPSLARLVVENLVENAWKYTVREPAARIEFGKGSVEGEDAFYVRDNGIGFDMSHAARIFAPFERLHRVDEFDGTGIGLATVQRVVARHGGRVWAEAEPEKGATFYFTQGYPDGSGKTVAG